MKSKKKYVGMVNGNVVYKWAESAADFKRLCMRDAMSKSGRCVITDHRIIESKRYETVKQ